MDETIGGFTTSTVAGVLTDLSQHLHRINQGKGFYDEVENLRLMIEAYLPLPSKEAEREALYRAWFSHWLQGSMARAHSELSEGNEYIRKNLSAPDDHLPQHPGLACELADTIYRCLDTAAFLGYDIGQILLDKMEYNKGRPFKHGKNS